MLQSVRSALINSADMILHMAKWMKNRVQMKESYIRMEESDDDVTPTNSISGSSSSSSDEMSRTSSVETVRQSVRIFCEDVGVITDMLVCSACNVQLMPPLMYCQGGHSYCQVCSSWLNTCVLCFKPMSITRNNNMDQIAEWARYFCRSLDLGCDVRLSAGLMSDHIKHCQFRKITCPVNKHQDRCSWKGMMMNLSAHAKYSHAKQMILASNFLSRKTTHECKVVFHAGEMFVFHKIFCEGNWLCLLQQAGITSRNFVSVFQLNGNNGVDSIEMTVPVEVISSSISFCYLMGKCFRMSEFVMKHFTDSEEMNMRVIIKEVTEHRNP